MPADSIDILVTAASVRIVVTVTTSDEKVSAISTQLAPHFTQPSALQRFLEPIKAASNAITITQIHQKPEQVSQPAKALEDNASDLTLDEASEFPVGRVVAIAGGCLLCIGIVVFIIVIVKVRDRRRKASGSVVGAPTTVMTITPAMATSQSTSSIDINLNLSLRDCNSTGKPDSAASGSSHANSPRLCSPRLSVDNSAWRRASQELDRLERVSHQQALQEERTSISAGVFDSPRVKSPRRSIAQQASKRSCTFTFTKPSMDAPVGLAISGAHDTAEEFVPTVEGIEREGLAASSGLRVGDKILRINGALLSGHAHLCELIKTAVGVVTVEIVPRDLMSEHDASPTADLEPSQDDSRRRSTHEVLEVENELHQLRVQMAERWEAQATAEASLEAVGPGAEPSDERQVVVARQALGPSPAVQRVKAGSADMRI